MQIKFLQAQIDLHKKGLYWPSEIHMEQKCMKITELADVRDPLWTLLKDQYVMDFSRYLKRRRSLLQDIGSWAERCLLLIHRRHHHCPESCLCLIFYARLIY